MSDQLRAAVQAVLIQSGVEGGVVTDHTVIDNLRTEHEREGAYGVAVPADAAPWPIRDAVAKLCEATEHLREAHDCDTHGHEEFWIALDVARQWLLRMSLAAEQPEQPDNQWPECSGDPASCPENEGYGCCKPNPEQPAVRGQQ